MEKHISYDQTSNLIIQLRNLDTGITFIQDKLLIEFSFSGRSTFLENGEI